MILGNRRGTPHADAEHLAPYRSALAQRADKRHTQGTADEMPGGALLALPGPAAISAAAARGTAPRAIVFAMANPVHEVHPESATTSDIIATGHHDAPTKPQARGER